jgi:predicted nucleotidyltransferase
MAASEDSPIGIIKKYIERLTANNIPVQKVLFFGSYIKGTNRVDSDIDVAIISSVFKGDRYSDRRMIVPFRRGLDSRIEPMPFTPEDFMKGGVLIDEIKKTGYSIDIQ